MANDQCWYFIGGFCLVLLSGQGAVLGVPLMTSSWNSLVCPHLAAGNSSSLRSGDHVQCLLLEVLGPCRCSVAESLQSHTWSAPLRGSTSVLGSVLGGSAVRALGLFLLPATTRCRVAPLHKLLRHLSVKRAHVFQVPCSSFGSLFP